MAIAVSTPSEIQANPQVASAVRAGLTSIPKRLPPWLFYDASGSQLFDEITALEEYYLTRIERSILADNAEEILERASRGRRLRISELGAGSADKTRVLLASAVERHGRVQYEPVDVSMTALLAARNRIEREIPGVQVAPLVGDYTNGFVLDPVSTGERRLVLYIGSSIGNFEPSEAARLLEKIHGQLAPGDGLLLGVDLVKDDRILLAAYDDGDGTTAAFNKNILVRLNRELAADFELADFTHRALWNPDELRIEMHLVSRRKQNVCLAALDLVVAFEAGESIHTENSYKYEPSEVKAMLADAGFALSGCWTDPQDWFAVCLGRVV